MKFLAVVIISMVLVTRLAKAAEDDEALRFEQFLTRVLVTNLTYDDGAGNALRSPSGICFDARANEVILAATGNSRITIYDDNLIPKYSFVHFVTDSSTGRQVPGEPRAVAVLSTGDLLILDNVARYVDVVDYRGTRITRLFPAELIGNRSLSLRATSVVVDANDNIYLAVSGDLETVLMLGSDFVLKRTIGEKGSGPKQFSNIFSLTVADSLLYVADLYSYPAVKLFDTSGLFVTGFAGHEQERGDVSMPSGIGLMPDTLNHTNIIIVSDALRHCIDAYSETGELLSIIGGYGVRVGEWLYPSGMAIGTKNVFYVVERGTGRVQKVGIRPPR